MGSPEQPHNEGEEMADTLEGKEGLQSAIQVLRDVAEQFRALDDEAEVLLANQDAAGVREKLRERAQLLVDLPDQLADALGGVDQETRDEILHDISYFATAAQEALESEGAFDLGVSLTHRGGKIGGKNDLESLIERLESKLGSAPP